MNLNQTTTKIDETWGIASALPREHIPKRSHPKDQKNLENSRGDQEGLGFSQKLNKSNSKELVIPEGLGHD